MTRRHGPLVHLTAGVAALLALSAPVAPAHAQGGEQAARLRATIALLNEEISTKGFQEATFKLPDALSALQEQARPRALHFVVNREAFTQDGLVANDADVTIPRTFPAKVSLGDALRAVLASVPNATFLVRPGHIEITTQQAASLDSLLRQRVAASFEKQPLEEVVKELAARGAVSVVIDLRAGEKAKSPVTATFANDVSLGAALRLLADMAGLKLVTGGDGVYITTPANADALRKEFENVPFPGPGSFGGPGGGGVSVQTLIQHRLLPPYARPFYHGPFAPTAGFWN